MKQTGRPRVGRSRSRLAKREPKAMAEVRVVPLTDPARRLATARELVLGNVVRPRMRRLASHFHNAVLVGPGSDHEQPCTCVFLPVLDCPSQLSVSFAFIYDLRLHRAVLRHALEVEAPPREHHRATEIAVSVDRPRLSEIAAWVDRRLLGVLNTCWPLLRRVTREPESDGEA